MKTIGFALFETAVGDCAIAWSDTGVTGVQLPEADAAAARARMKRRFRDAMESAPPASVAKAIEDIRALVRGKHVDLRSVDLDTSGVPEFYGRVYEVARTIMPGSTMTYGEIAKQVGDASAARTVGEAMAKNPFPIVVPCHRVLAAGGKLGGFSAGGGVVTKRKLLTIEGAFAADTLELFPDL